MHQRGNRLRRRDRARGDRLLRCCAADGPGPRVLATRHDDEPAACARHTAVATVRTFVAILLPEDVRARLAEAVTSLRALAADVAWVAPENFHLTLKFLGAVEESRLADVTAAVARVAAATPRFALGVRGLGAFPSATRARVLWAGVDDGEGRLVSLGEAVDIALGGLGFPGEGRPFAGHVTLGRVREPRRRPALGNALAAGATRTFGAINVDRASVMRSDLSPRGARYTELAACRLA